MTRNDVIRIVTTTVVGLALVAGITYQYLVISKYQDRVQEANDRLFRVVHGSPVATVMCNEAGNIVEYNRAAEEMFGWNRSEVIHKPVSMLIDTKDREEHGNVFKDAVERLRTIDEDWRITRSGIKGSGLSRDGRSFPVIFSTRGIRFGGRIEFLALLKKDAPAPIVESKPFELPKKPKENP